MSRFNFVEALRLSFGATAGRFGLFLALYFALFKILEKIARHYRGRDDSWNAFIAGATASLALAVEEENSRWMLAQYLLVRALACAWSSFQARHPSLDPYAQYGDALLFALCSGQAVYCFVVRPETVDHAYSQFLTKVTQMNPLLIDLFRSRIRTGQLDSGLLARIMSSGAAQRASFASNLLHHQPTAHINCSLIHPGMSCAGRILWVLYANFRSVLPMYFSLHLVPVLLLKYKSAMAKYIFTGILCQLIRPFLPIAYVSPFRML